MPERSSAMFATRAYRRPITAAEESALMAVFQKSSAADAAFRSSVKDALQVVLTSPQFLFLIENSNTPAPEPLDELRTGFQAVVLPVERTAGSQDPASWPRAASLRKQLDAEVERMIADPRFSRFVSEFASQWLSLDKFQVLEPDRKQFPKLTRDTRAQLRQEPVAVPSVPDPEQPAGAESDPVRFRGRERSRRQLLRPRRQDRERLPVCRDPARPAGLGGVLTQAAIMAGLSDGRESNPVKRGAWLARKIIAEPPDDPPPNVPALKEDTKQLTLRQRLEQHRNQPACIQCHAKIDPWGVAFEEFDAGGRLKQQPVDARSTLPDKTEVSGVNDLKRYLAKIASIRWPSAFSSIWRRMPPAAP